MNGSSNDAPSKPSRIGLIGLAVMGQNLARNIERNGFPIAVFNRSVDRVREFMSEFGPGAGGGFFGAESLESFVANLERPRAIILLVKAGAPVDELIRQLTPLLQPGDVLIDGGNSHFLDTRRRRAELAARGLRFVGSGVSGGEEGALEGPSLMPGGDPEGYARIEPIWRAIAAKVDDGPCCAYVGEDGAGHYVKMVHNGIEYGDMQLIAEAYDLLRLGAGMQADELAETFADWNRGPLESFLIEITATIFRRRDEETGRPLVELVLDAAGQKGTGKWTAASAIELGVPVPTLAAAVDARGLSSRKEARVAASRVLPGPAPSERGGAGEGASAPALVGDARRRFVEDVRDALLASKIAAYAQGMELIRAAGAEYGWSLDLAEIARIWKGGCIIRARLLDRIKEAYRRDAGAGLALDPEFAAELARTAPAWRRACASAVALGVPIPAMGASLSWFDSIRRAELPQNLIQAQRDLFGAHTFLRKDKPGEGPFHAKWD